MGEEGIENKGYYNSVPKQNISPFLLWKIFNSVTIISCYTPMLFPHLSRRGLSANDGCRG